MSETSTNNTLQLPKHIRYVQNPEEAIIAWSNRKSKRNSANIYGVGLAILFFGGIGLFLTYEMFRTRPWEYGFLTIDSLGTLFGCAVCWLLCIVMILVLYSSVTWIESIHIREKYLVYKRTGFWSPKPRRISQEEIVKIFFGYEFELDYRFKDDPHFFHTLGGSDNETSFAGNQLVILHGYGFSSEIQKMEFIASWLSTEDKLLIFYLLEQLLRNRGWFVRFQEGKRKRYTRPIEEVLTERNSQNPKTYSP